MRAPLATLPLALLAASCAGAPTPPKEDAPRLPASAWTVGDAQGIELLARVVALDTQQPRGREEAAAKVLRDFLLRAGVEARMLPLGAGRASLFAEYRGGAPAGAAPIVLLSHLDSHPATPEAWPVDAGPFSATIQGDALWGRGVLDGKGLAVLHALVLSALKASGLTLSRPVLMLAAAGGLESGTPGLVRAIEAVPALANAELVLTKGGGSWIDMFGDGRIAHLVATSERGFARVRVTAAARRDEVGQGDTAVRRLSHALDAVFARVEAPRLTRPTLDTLEAASRGVYFPKSLVMRSTPLARTFLLQDLAHRESTAPLVRDSVEVTFVGSNRAGGRLPPDRAWAVLEGRLLPGSTPGRLRGALRAAIRDPDVHVTVEAGGEWSGSAISAARLELFGRHARLDGEVEQVLVPAMSPEPSGARPLRDVGAPVYGFTPFVLEPEAWARARAREERLPLEDFRRALRVLGELVAELAGPQSQDHSTR